MNPRYPAVDIDDPARELIHTVREDRGFLDFDEARSFRFPLLARSLEERRPANSSRIDWVIDVLGSKGQGRVCLYNLTQIQRVAVALNDKSEEELRLVAFDVLCRDTEAVLWDGKRSGLEWDTVQYGPPIYTCGGVRELLGRDPVPRDVIKLRPLREPTWTVTRYPEELGGDIIGEWISEFSLEVIPGSPPHRWLEAA